MVPSFFDVTSTLGLMLHNGNATIGRQKTHNVMFEPGMVLGVEVEGGKEQSPQLRYLFSVLYLI